MQGDIQHTQLAVWFFRIADGLAMLLAAYCLGLRWRNLVFLSAILFTLFHLLPGLLAH